MDYKAPAMATLYHNHGDGTFEDVTVAAGWIKCTAMASEWPSVTSTTTVGSTFISPTTPCQINYGLTKGNGTFKDEAMFRGVRRQRVGCARGRHGCRGG